MKVYVEVGDRRLPIPPEILRSLACGRIIEAIKGLRQEYDLELQEAKEAVDALRGHEWRSCAQCRGIGKLLVYGN